MSTTKTMAYPAHQVVRRRVYILCIPESNYVSGQVLIVDGGLNS